MRIALDTNILAYAEGTNGVAMKSAYIRRQTVRSARILSDVVDRRGGGILPSRYHAWIGFEPSVASALPTSANDGAANRQKRG